MHAERKKIDTKRYSKEFILQCVQNIVNTFTSIFEVRVSWQKYRGDIP